MTDNRHCRISAKPVLHCTHLAVHLPPMKGTSVKHVHISPLHAIVMVAVVVAAFGTMHLLALSHPKSRFFKAWLGLGF